MIHQSHFCILQGTSEKLVKLFLIHKLHDNVGGWIKIKTADCVSKIPDVQIIYHLTYFVQDNVSYQQKEIVFI